MNFCQWLFERRARVLTLFFILDFLVYFDRGIVPGSHNEITTFLMRTPALRQKPELYFGALQSVFIGGMAIGAPTLAYLSAVHKSSFYYLSLGLVLWLVSILGCAFADYFDSALLLYLSRAISGVGEGAFVGLMAPMLLDATSCHNRGVVLGLFYGLMPAGMTSGFVVSAAIVYAGYSWSYTFGLLAICGTLPIFALLLGSIYHKDGISTLKQIDENRTTNPTIICARELETSGEAHIPDQEFSNCQDRTESVASFRLCSMKLFHSNVFLALLLCGAALATAGASLSSFGAAFLMNLGLVQSELSAATAMGSFAALTITLGTFLGGFWIRGISALEDEKDWVSPRGTSAIKKSPREWPGESTAAYRLRLHRIESHAKAISKLGGTAAIGLTLAPALLYFNISAVWAVGSLAIGLVLLGSIQSGLNVCVMSSAPEQYRALALSIYTLGLHLLGDVPGPIMVGCLKDHFAPHCGPEGSEVLCKSERTPLLGVLGFALSWTNLGWIGCWWAMSSARNAVLRSLNDVS